LPWQASLAAHAAHAEGSFWDHAPELIVVGVGFIAFMAYLWQERRNDRRRPLGLPTTTLDGWQWVTVALLVISAIGHVPVVPEHLSEAPYMGILFIGYVVAASALSAALAIQPTAARYAAAVVLCASAIGAYVATRLIAFPELAGDVGAWREPLGVMCVSAELAVVVTAAVQLWRLSGRRHPDPRVAVS
jgi:hypothetical protein